MVVMALAVMALAEARMACFMAATGSMPSSRKSLKRCSKNTA